MIQKQGAFLLFLKLSRNGWRSYSTTKKLILGLLWAVTFSDALAGLRTLQSAVWLKMCAINWHTGCLALRTAFSAPRVLAKMIGTQAIRIAAASCWDIFCQCEWGALTETVADMKLIKLLMGMRGPPHGSVSDKGSLQLHWTILQC